MSAARLLGVASAAAPLLLTGCITLAGDALDDLEPAAGSIAPEIEQTVGPFSFHLDGGKLVTSNKAGREINDEVLKRWQQAGFISGHHYVKSARFAPDAKYRLTLGGHQEGESSLLLQILSGLSLYAIPYYVNTRFDLHYTLENAETGCSFSTSVSDSFNAVIGLLMIPAAPFAQGGRTRTLDRIASHAYQGLASQGAFDEHPSCRKAPASLAERLRELETLHSEGLVDDAEYERLRRQILGEL